METYHVRAGGHGIAMETTDNMEAIREVMRLKSKGMIAAIVYGDGDKMRRKAVREYGKNWLKPIA